MLQLKYLLPQFLRCAVGDGRKASFWYDYWTDLGPIHLLFGPAGSRHLRLPYSASVCDAVSNDNWNMPSVRSENAVTLHIILSTTPVPSVERGPDTYLWRLPSGRFGSHFSAHATWNRLRIRSHVVAWHDTVWFKEEIPKCSFITWLSMLQRLPTKDRLISWGVSLPPACVLFPSGVESHRHLFFECSYSAAIWSRFCGRFISSPPTDLPAFVALIATYQGVFPAQVKPLFKLILQVIIYSLWRERNARIFKNVSLPPSAFFALVDRALRDRLLSFSPSLSSSHSLLELYFWFIAPYS
ncbi:hypothetical protein N665_0080s0008 [Sinapis alba]|nr:hypothetical protein N665_0080s0008 [Sinapis alba]